MSDFGYIGESKGAISFFLICFCLSFKVLMSFHIGVKKHMYTYIYASTYATVERLTPLLSPPSCLRPFFFLLIILNIFVFCFFFFLYT